MSSKCSRGTPVNYNSTFYNNKNERNSFKQSPKVQNMLNKNIFSFFKNKPTKNDSRVAYKKSANISIQESYNAKYKDMNFKKANYQNLNNSLIYNNKNKLNQTGNIMNTKSITSSKRTSSRDKCPSKMV